MVINTTDIELSADEKILKAMYVHYSMPQIKNKTGMTIYKIRKTLIKLGVARSCKEAKMKEKREGTLSINKGDKRVFTQQWKDNISKAKLAKGDINAKGICLKPNGYLEITRGENIGRGQHRVIMEEHLGRKLLTTEHIHHIDGCKTNNQIENLQVMTINEHTSHHAKQNSPKRKRDKLGRYA